MNVRHVFDDAGRPSAHAAAAPAPDGVDLAAQREAGERLLAAGDEAIGRALSGDSEGFLAANRQQSGQ